MYMHVHIPRHQVNCSDGVAFRTTPTRSLKIPQTCAQSCEGTLWNLPMKLLDEFSAAGLSSSRDWPAQYGVLKVGRGLVRDYKALLTFIGVYWLLPGWLAGQACGPFLAKPGLSLEASVYLPAIHTVTLAASADGLR